MKPMIVHERELPLAIVVQGDNGEREVYQLTRAGRKFGAFLQKVTEPLKNMVLQLIAKK